MGCRWLEALLAVVIIVFAYWPTMVFSANISMWIVIAAAAVLLVHALFCDKCKGLCRGMMKSGRSSGRHKRRR
ncbi:MAG: hypothetical protein AABX93_00875 [Nanoarchaeota archaeon]